MHALLSNVQQYNITECQIIIQFLLFMFLSDLSFCSYETIIMPVCHTSSFRLRIDKWVWAKHQARHHIFIIYIAVTVLRLLVPWTVMHHSYSLKLNFSCLGIDTWWWIAKQDITHRIFQQNRTKSSSITCELIMHRMLRDNKSRKGRQRR